MRRCLFLLSLFWMCQAFSQTPESLFEEFEGYQFVYEDSAPDFSRSFKIRISNQDSFSKLNETIKTAIQKGEKSILVELRPGEYFFDDSFLSLSRINAPLVDIRIVGNKSIIIGGGRDYKIGEQVAASKNSSVFIDKDYQEIPVYGDVIQLNDQVEVFDTKNKICRIKINDRIVFHKGMQIQLSEWYLSPVYDVIKIEEGFLYFKAKDLKFDKNRDCYNVNYDYGVSSLIPRYRLFDPILTSTTNVPIHECVSSSFLEFKNVKLHSFSIDGLVFVGSAYGKKPLFLFDTVDSSCLRINDCSFNIIRNSIVKLYDTDNFAFTNNNVENCYRGSLFSYIDCRRTVVMGNRFYRTGLSWTNCACVACYGEAFWVANNEFENVGYISIRSGAYYKWTNEKTTYGIIENNHIWFSNDFKENSYKYSLIDSGAIYLGTISKRIIVRYNYIHDYAGIGSNRGIYCDDGAMNVKIYGNVISDIPNGDAVFSWRSTRMNKLIPGSNDGIAFFYNIINGRYRFDEIKGSSCVHGKNIILYDEAKGIPDNRLVRFAYKENDLFFPIVSNMFDHLHLSEEAMSEMMKLPTCNGMKKWVE